MEITIGIVELIRREERQQQQQHKWRIVLWFGVQWPRRAVQSKIPGDSTQSGPILMGETKSDWNCLTWFRGTLKCGTANFSTGCRSSPSNWLVWLWVTQTSDWTLKWVTAPRIRSFNCNVSDTLKLTSLLLLQQTRESTKVKRLDLGFLFVNPTKRVIFFYVLLLLKVTWDIGVRHRELFLAFLSFLAYVNIDFVVVELKRWLISNKFAFLITLLTSRK